MKIKDITILAACLVAMAIVRVQAQTSTIESDIHSSFNYIFKNSSMNKIDSIIDELQRQSKGKENRYLTYWLSYARYEKAIASFDYYNSNKEKNASLKKTGMSLLDESIKDIDGIHDKTSEDYALLAIMKNASLPFSSPMRIPFISKDVKRYATQAVEMDSLNIRGWLALAILDRYTPELYGGGKQFEELFTKILTLKDKHTDFPYDPSWGKDEAYVNLITYYRKNNPEKAMALLDEAIKLYPESLRLQALQKSR